MRPRHLVFSPRRDRDQDHQTFPRDRDETETFEFQPDSPRRDRDQDSALIGRDRDIFRDVLAFFATCQSHDRNLNITICLFKMLIIID